MKPTRTLIATFAIDGEPVSKSRARFTKRGSKTYAYTPERTKVGEERVAWAFRQVHRKPATDAEVAYRVEARFYNGTRQRRDIDNMTKLILDGLNGVAWVDDNQVVEIEARKSYVPKAEARTEVAVYEVGRLDPPKAPCVRCGKEFRTYPSWESDPKGKKYCSLDCRNAHIAEASPVKPRPCEHCGREFRPHSSRGGRFCSMKCHSASSQVDVDCSECGKTFGQQANLIARRKTHWCSEECRAEAKARAGRECIRGHLWSEHGTVDSRGKRRCRRCAADRQRAPGGVAYADRTHCPKGHPYDEENTYISPSTGWRSCRACNKEACARYRERREAGEPDKVHPRIVLTITPLPVEGQTERTEP